MEYALHLEVDMQPEKALNSLRKILCLESASNEEPLEAPGVVISAFKQSLIGQEIIEEAFSFRPETIVWFRIKPKERRVIGRKTLLTATLGMLKECSGDAVLLFNGEDVVLKRIHGKLVANEAFSFWVAPELDKANQPYEVKDIPSPLL